MRIRRTMIEVIPHNAQQYETVGNYFIDPFGVNRIQVSDMGNEDYHFLVSLHEFVEEHLTRRRGLTEKEITDFDLQYEQERTVGLHSEDEEPGFDPRAPYLLEHTIATGIEMLLAGHMGISWPEYDNTVMSLGQAEPLQPPAGSQPGM